MFIVQGVTLLVMDKPGGMVAAAISATSWSATRSPTCCRCRSWSSARSSCSGCWLKNTRFGVALYAIGSDVDAARAAGIPTRLVAVSASMSLAGGCYGVAGVFISAQTGSGDPLIGNADAAADVRRRGASAARVLGGGRGGALGSVVGAYILMIVVNILLVLNVSAYYSTGRRGRASSSSPCLPASLRRELARSPSISA